MRAINKARGSTMIVDRAYQLLLPNNGKDFGREAIEMIMGSIEGEGTTGTNRPAYIFAGYPNKKK